MAEWCEWAAADDLKDSDSTEYFQLATQTQCNAMQPALLAIATNEGASLSPSFPSPTRSATPERL
eukprot:scaffold1237_cov243-Pinguiococcus_pyrenoidosus.AAC.46